MVDEVSSFTLVNFARTNYIAEEISLAFQPTVLKGKSSDRMRQYCR